MSQQLREAERSIAEGRYSDAVVRLGDLLQRDSDAIDEDDGAGQDFFIDVEVDGSSQRLVSESLLHRARRLIGELPQQGFEIYELRYGALARKTLEEASTTRDWTKVALVRRKYFHTDAGYEASMLLAEREWLGGRPLATYLLLEELVASPTARRRLGKALDDLFAAAAKVAGREVDDKQLETIGDWIKNYSTDSKLSNRSGATSRSSDYRLLGGTLDRNGGDDGEMPLASPRWRVETTASSRQEKTLSQRAEEMATRGELPPPSFVPLKVGDQLLMRTTERLVGVDYRTGKRIWEYPWYSAYEGFDEDEESFDAIPGDDGPGDLLTQRVWNDLPFGQMSSDGERVFVLDDLGQVEMATFNPIIGLQGTRPADLGRNSLVALDLKTQGKLLWRIGSGADQPTSLSDAFFLGPPLPLDNQLYVLIEIAGDVCLSCLDPRSGIELWRQQLVAIESGGIETDPIRRVAGAVPTYQRGVLICPTGAGATVAVDLVDQMLRWGRSYPRNMEQSNAMFNASGFEQGQLMKRWYAGAAIAADDTVILTPVESDQLLAVDLLSGEDRFPEKLRIKLRYVAGVRDGKIIVVGANQIRALDIATGESIWTTPLDWLSAGQQISGLGLFASNEYLVPTTSNQLIRISLNDGSVLERRTTRYPLGNLIATAGEFISQSPTLLSVAFGEKSLEPAVNAILSSDPNNFEAMVRKSELLIQEGKRDEALEYLMRARTINPDSDEVHALSISAMLGSLRESPAMDGPIVSLLEELIERPLERVELLGLRVQAGFDKQAFVDTAKLLIELSEQIRLETSIEGIDLVSLADPARQCVLDCWIEARMHDLYLRSSESERAEIDELVIANITPLSNASSNVLQRVMRHFSATQSIESIRDTFGQRMITEGNLLKAERSSLGIMSWSKVALGELSDARLETLAVTSLLGGFRENAVEAAGEIDFKSLALSAPERAAELSNLKASQPGSKDSLWPKTATLNWADSPSTGRRMMQSFTQSIAQTFVTGGPSFAGWKLISEFQNPIAFRDTMGQLRGVPLDGIRGRDEGEKESLIDGGVSLVVTPTELLCIDLYELLEGSGESIIWRRDWSGDSGPIAKRRSEMTPLEDTVFRYRMITSTAQSTLAEFRVGPILGDRVIMLQGGELMALDLFTSTTLWRNANAPRSGSILSDGHTIKVVSPETREIVSFSAFDGAKLETQPWTYGAVWAAQNRFVLSYDPIDANRQTTIRMIDVFTNTVIHELTTDAANRSAEGTDASFGRVIDGRYMVVLNNRGKLWLWDIQSGTEIGQCQLPEMVDLQGIHAVALDGQIMVLPYGKKDIQSSPLASETVTSSSGLQHQRTDGVFAVSTDDASLRWSFDDSTEWGVTLHPPSATPVLLLSRSHNTNSTTGSRLRELDVLALDVRDGNVINKRMGRQVAPQTNELETRLVIQPESERVIVQIGIELLTYKFGEPDAMQAPDDAEPELPQ